MGTLKNASTLSISVFFYYCQPSQSCIGNSVLLSELGFIGKKGQISQKLSRIWKVPFTKIPKNQGFHISHQENY